MLTAAPLRVGISAALVAAAAIGCSTSGRAEPPMADYCAVMTDSIGLYRGNSVTRMGVPVGTITRIDPGNTWVRVTFTLDPGVEVPAQVRALTRTPTILADRNLELSGGDTESGALLPGSCIPMERTVTAKSISESASAATTLINQMKAAGRGDSVNRLVSALGVQLPGTGPVMRDTLTNLAAAVRDPLPGGANDGQLLTDIASVLAAADTNWDSVENAVEPLASVLRELAGGALADAAQLFGPVLGQISDVLLDLATHYHDLLWATLDTATATVRLLSEHTGVIVTYAGTLPNILDGVRSFWARLRARPIPVISPRVAAGATDDGKVCSRLSPDGPDRCGFFYGVPDGITSVDVLQLVLNGGVKQP